MGGGGGGSMCFHNTFFDLGGPFFPLGGGGGFELASLALVTYIITGYRLP